MQIKKNEKKSFYQYCSYFVVIFQLLKRKKLKAVLEKQRLDWNNGDMIDICKGI
jgi:hypothetical protein